MIQVDFAIIGGGIVGLATGSALLDRHPGSRIAILEKEQSWGVHQTGHNSGVIHSGIYYKPGSLKATLARQGNLSMVEFCRTHGIPHQVCGKVIVATRPEQLPLLEKLYQRGLENRLDVVRLNPAGVRQIEPHVQCLAGVQVPSTGIVDYKAVCRKLAELIQLRGGVLRLGSKVLAIRRAGDSQVIQTTKDTLQARTVINCAGLHSDRVARMGGVEPQAKIVPFRGEYFELRPERRFLVKTLVYPVPNPAFPFLGVHFTRMIDGSVHAGPNAVLSFRREGYHKTDFSLRDFAEVMLYPGFWKLARRHAREGLKEMARSFSKAHFVRSLQELIPEIRAEDLVPAEAGVRAQALLRNGDLVDDFLIVGTAKAIHVCNAPSPAATASLEIGKAILAHVEDTSAEAAGACSPPKNSRETRK
ncbi:MAG: L-2-hydroxyglutarate oxidase [Verrucomicrobiota bacterium]